MTSVGTEPPPYWQMDGFLADNAVDELLAFVGSSDGDLRPSGVTVAGNDRVEDLRRSRTLGNCEPIWPLFHDTLSQLLPVVRRELGVGHFLLSRIERQLTVHFDGDFFGPHNDSGSPDVESRRLTFVYYFNRAPRRFTGGALRLYHSIDEAGAKHE